MMGIDRMGAETAGKKHKAQRKGDIWKRQRQEEGRCKWKSQATSERGSRPMQENIVTGKCKARHQEQVLQRGVVTARPARTHIVRASNSHHRLSTIETGKITCEHEVVCHVPG